MTTEMRTLMNLLTEQSGSTDGSTVKRWMDYRAFLAAGQVLVPDQRVRVEHRGFAGTSVTYQTVTKIVATYATLDDGARYVLATGDQVGRRAKAEDAPRIIRVLAVLPTQNG